RALSGSAASPDRQFPEPAYGPRHGRGFYTGEKSIGFQKKRKIARDSSRCRSAICTLRRTPDSEGHGTGNEFKSKPVSTSFRIRVTSSDERGDERFTGHSYPPWDHLEDNAPLSSVTFKLT
ncbi:unnamed protein product, partial [Nesidiocoris tenuis]